jgi:hypothetical protein
VITATLGDPKVYRCDAGHEVRIDAGTYTTLVVQYCPEPSKGYNYCMHCFGAWAVRQFPLKLQESPEP